MPEHQQIQQSKKTNTIFQKQVTPISQTPVSNPYSIIQRAKINPKSLTHADIMQLQRTIGNRAVGRLLSGIGNTSTAQQATVQRQEILEEEEHLQGKFESVQRQEIPEEEKPLQVKMAETIQRQEILEEEESLQGKMIQTIQRQEMPEEEEPLQGKVAEPLQLQEIPEEEEPLQGKMIETVQRQEIPEEEESLQTKRENNTGMPDNLKAGVENLSGIDMSDVRVHNNSDKPAKIGALAYTQGTDIHVVPGQEKHLPHEAWHVVQQAQGRVRPTLQLKDLPVNDDAELEHEADVMGNRALQMKRANTQGLHIIQLQNVAIQKLSEDQIKRMNDDDQKKTAKELDTPGGGHGLARHGPDVPDEVLVKRLKQGYIHETFSPAPGISTRWTNYKLYLITRVRAQKSIEEAFNNSWQVLSNPITAHKNAEFAYNNTPPGPAKGAAGLAQVAAWNNLTHAVDTHHLTNLGHPHFLPIRIVGHEICLNEEYDLVLRHDDLPSLGTGFRGEKPYQINNPNGVIDPATHSIRRETLFKKVSPIGHGIFQAATTFRTNGSRLLGSTSPQNWMIIRHYPDNRQPHFY